MSGTVRFILGRAGSGKTFHCLEAIRSRLRGNPIDGPRLVFLVPEQASQQMERALLLGGKETIEASHRAEVLSYQRLSSRVLETDGRPSVPGLSDAARVMVIRHLLDEQLGNLRYYKRRDRFAGVATKLSAAIAEFMQEGITPESLGQSVSRDDGAPALDAKLADLSLLYGLYLRFLDLGFTDPSRHLATARLALPNTSWLKGAEVWVDGFASMSGEEMRTFVELARCSARTEITALVDSTQDGASADRDWTDMFAKTRRTIDELAETLIASGLAIEEPLRLGSRSPPRFKNAPSLEQVERDWMRIGVEGGAPTGLELAELPSRRVEVDYAVSRIAQWASREGYRFRDLAIVARDLEPYHELLAAALESRRIPFFIDRRHPAAHHPLVELVRAATAAVVEDFSLPAAQLLLKCGLFPLSDDVADELENYVLAHGIAGWARWTGEDWKFRRRGEIAEVEPEATRVEAERLRRVNDARRATVISLTPWMTNTRESARRTGREWVKALAVWLESLGVGARLEEWSRADIEDGALDEAEAHQQVWTELLSLLDDLSLAFAETNLSLDEFAGVLEAGLSGLTLGLIPPTLDQVLVGAIERSRHPDIQAAVVIGLNDGLFPARPVEDAVLNDEDRIRLRANGFRLAPPAREAAIEESMLAYIALTRASEQLVVTYAAADERGKALEPSPFVATLCSAHPGLEVGLLADPSRSGELWDLWSNTDLVARVPDEFRRRPPLAEDEQCRRALWNEIYDSIRGDFPARRTLRRAMEGLARPRSASLSLDMVRRRHRDSLRTSVSQLESLAACPFQHFARHTLHLQARAEVDVQAVDVGQVQHAILESFVADMAATGRRWADLIDENDWSNRLAKSCDYVGGMLAAGGLLEDPRNAVILRRSGPAMGRVLSAQRRFWKSTAARPRVAEAPFGMNGEDALPALELTTPKNRRILIRGKIDRVDIIESSRGALGVVLDYKKAREKKLDFSRVYHGLSLQLLTYWLVLAEHGGQWRNGGITPAAALYVPVTPDYRKVEHPSEANQDSDDSSDPIRWRGMIHSKTLDVIEPGAPPKWSPVLQVYRGKNGLGHRDKIDAVESEVVEAMLTLVRQRIGDLADALLDGRVEVNPYRIGPDSACRWCGMEAACRIDPGQTPIRRLSPVSRVQLVSPVTTTADPS